MSKITRWTVLTAVSLLILPLGARAADDPPPVPADQFKETIRVACVGDSITAGAGAPRGESYPDQLGRMLGEKWQVRNFGVSGSTLLAKGDKPYIKEKAYAAALEYKPDVVVIALGTNDSKHPTAADAKAPNNWQHKADFAADYKALIAAFRQANPKVIVYVCLPVPAFPGRWGINEETIKNEICPIIRTMASEAKVGVIDLYAALTGKKEMFPDTVHPNKEGAGLLAAEVCRVLTGKAAAKKAA